MSRHAYETTRTSPFGHYGECLCGWITRRYRATAREAWRDVVRHVETTNAEPAEQTSAGGLSLGECLAYTGRGVLWLTDQEFYWIGGTVKDVLEVMDGDQVVVDHLVAVVSQSDPGRVEWAHPSNLILAG